MALRASSLCGLLFCALLFCVPALAAPLEIPLRVPLEALQEALGRQLAGPAAQGGEIFRDGPCRNLVLEAPKLEAREGRLRLTGPGKGKIGVELLGKCQNAVDWAGTIQLGLVPRIDDDGRLRMHVVDSTLDDDRDPTTSGAKLVWDLAKPQVHERLERFSYDLAASRSALAEMLRSAVPPAQAAAMEQVLDRLEVRQPRIEAAHLVVPLVLDLPQAWASAPAPAASATPLTEAEVAALEEALAPFDAFLVYSIRQVALDSDDGPLRRRLFDLLLESRYQLVALLSGDEPAAGDPLRALLIDSWNGLRGILADAQRQGLLGKSVLRYALFVEGGDALVALERAAPGLPLSAQGLRQLARSLRPGETGDPLAHGWDVDPQLLQMFGVEEIQLLQSAPEPEPPPAPKPAPTSSLGFLIRTAQGDAGAAPSSDAANGPRSLERWVPAQDELPAYQSRIGELLEKVSAASLERGGLAAPYDTVFRNLVPTTALIESCWHQYVKRGAEVRYLRSAAGSVGIMQINQVVWRGFYDVKRLRWDTAYNAVAGAQILMRYVKDYAIPYAEKAGEPELAARAAYAVYNAGPRAVGRFGKAKAHPREARVDAKLWTLYRGIAAGGQADLKSCSVKGAGPA